MADQERMTAEEFRALFKGNAPAVSSGRSGIGTTKKPAIKGLKKPKRDIRPKAILARILSKPNTGKLRLQKEEQLAINFADELRRYTETGELTCVWVHPANEIAGRRSRLAAIRYTIAKRMGLVDGAADYLFLWANGSGALEAKVGKNKQQDNQLDFEWWCQQNGVHYEVFRTVDEGIAILEKWGVLKKR